MTKAQLIEAILELDEGYTKTSLKRNNKANLEELLKDLKDKQVTESIVEQHSTTDSEALYVVLTVAAVAIVVALMV